MHGCCVTDGMWANALAGNGGARDLRFGGIFANNVVHAETGDGISVCVEEQLILPSMFGSTLLEIILEGLGRFGPERTAAMLLAFSQELDLWSFVQSQVGHR